MLVKSIKLNNYRNYTSYSTDFDPHLNIIIGKNGIGKTNILESIIVISNGKSFRTLKDQDLIKKQEDYAKIELVSDNNTYKIVVNNKGKSLYIGEKLIRKASDYIGKVNAILFKPSDLQIFDESPSERRKILDIEIGKIEKNYLRSILRYNSLLKDKNKLLKELEIDENLLSIINESMIPNIKVILNEREKFLIEINKYISNYYNLISNTNSQIKIIYKKCCEIDCIKENIEASKNKDEILHYTTFGPHHDDYYFEIDGDNVNAVASQGQKRMILIAFKFALINYIKNKSNTIPILLLDDILSELDLDNQERLLKIIPEDTQTIITNTDINNLKINKKYKLIELKED